MTPTIKVLVLTASLAGTLAGHSSAHTLPPELEARLREKFTQFTADHGRLFEKLDPNDFRHPYERKVVGQLMKDEKVKALLPEANRVAGEINTAYHRRHLLSGVLCSLAQFPEIHKMAQENATALALKPGFKVYVMNSAQMNAYTWSIDEDNYGVALFSGLIKGLSREELRYVLAHEMGHVKSKHILTSILVELYYEKYEKLPPVFSLKDDGKSDDGAKRDRVQLTGAALGLGDLPASLRGDLVQRLGAAGLTPLKISETEEANLARMSQAAEYSSDRAGAVASGLVTESMMGLVKLASGHTGDAGGFDMATYLKQIETVLASLSHSELKEMMASEGSHAFTLMRVGELELFFKSPEYGKATDAKDRSVMREILSAEFQIATVLTDANEELKKFRSGNTAGEMNALERRLREKEFSETIGPRETAEAALSPLILDTIVEIGLASLSNAAFESYVDFARMKKTGVPVKPLTEKIIEKLKFALTAPDLAPEVKAELERKLKVAEEIKKLKPGKVTASAGETPADADK
jgi:hypothetical protein